MAILNGAVKRTGWTRKTAKWIIIQFPRKKIRSLVHLVKVKQSICKILLLFHEFLSLISTTQTAGLEQCDQMSVPVHSKKLFCFHAGIIKFNNNNIILYGEKTRNFLCGILTIQWLKFSAGLRNLTSLWRSNYIYHFCSKTKHRSFAVAYSKISCVLFFLL